MTSTMQAWEYSTIQDTLEKSLVLNSSAPIPSKSSLSKDQVLVEVITASINPVDYKLPESGLTGKLMIKRPASPGRDFSGRVVAVHPSNSTLKEGQLVFGAFGSPTTQFGTLRQFTVIRSSDCAILPKGVDADHAAAVGTAAMTAFQSLLPDLVKPGSKVFINGGSGGVGTFGIQFSKAFGAHVTTTCSTGNVELCKSLGADEILDYKKVDILSSLKKKGQVFDLAVDNVGSLANLYEQSHNFIKPSGTFAQVGTGGGMAMGSIFRRMLQPGFLGGGRRRFHFVRVSSNTEDYVKIGKLLVEGKVRVVIDESFKWQDAPNAFEKLRAGHVKGKIVIYVAKQ
jgi:NADPH:quinone reductase-like Zn-dependent oxidoreductase